MAALNSIAWLFWDPAKDAFEIPYFNIPIAWYGIFFASGFVIGYFMLQPMFARYLLSKDPQQENTKFLSNVLVDKLTWYVVIGTIVGARIGHVIFYDLPYYIQHPWEVLMIRQGGLASHGGTIGVMLGLYLFLRWNRKILPQMTYVNLIDLLVVPTALVGFLIRIGNFINQEILGNPTQVPWAIIFGHPADGSIPVPRHPVQLYEAFVYLGTFVFLFYLWKRYYESLKPGVLSGIFFILVFGSRFILDFFKVPQSMIIDESLIQTGQWLSLPFVLLGIGLLVRK